MKWSEALEVLERYGLKRHDIYAEHDQISIDMSPSDVDSLEASSEWEKLADFGFFIDNDRMLIIYV